MEKTNQSRISSASDYIISYFFYKKCWIGRESERLAWWLVITAQDYYKGTLVMSEPLPGFRLGLGKTVESRYYFVCYLYQ